jgi:general secretion pathway protein J
MSVSCQTRSGEQGFTLLELIVTLGLLSLIVAAIVGGLGTGRRVWQMQDDLEQLSATGAARALLAARLADAMPVMERSAKGVLLPAFEGATDRLMFVAPLPRSGSGGGLIHQVVHLAPTTGGRQNLVIEEAVFQGGGAPEQAVLIENVSGLAIRYLDSGVSRSAPAWTDAWTRTPALPKLIGVSITFPPGDPRRWPELMLAPRAGSAR